MPLKLTSLDFARPKVKRAFEPELTYSLSTEVITSLLDIYRYTQTQITTHNAFHQAQLLMLKQLPDNTLPYTTWTNNNKPTKSN